MRDAADRKETGPWVAPIHVDDVPDSGRHVVLQADETVRTALATYAGLRAVPSASASFDIRRHGRSGLHVTGEVRATVGQLCVVSLEPMESEIVELVDVVFRPAADSPPSGSAAPPDPGASNDDPPEPLVNGTADLGALATEFLILGIDPYPRKADAVFRAPPNGPPDEGPFAALARLKSASRKEK